MSDDLKRLQGCSHSKSGLFFDIILDAIISEMKDHNSTKFADLDYMMSKIENYEKFLQVKVDGNLEEDEEDNDSLKEIQDIKESALNTKNEYIKFKTNLIDLMT